MRFSGPNSLLKILMLPAERLEDYRAGNAPFPSVRINQDTVIDLFPKKLWEQKISGGKGLDFKKNLYINPFKLKNKGESVFMPEEILTPTFSKNSQKDEFF